MKRKISSALLRTILETEFFLSSCSSKKIHYSKSSVLTEGNQIFGLEVFELVKNLKQLIRVMKFLNEQKSKNIIFSSSNKNIISFLRLYIDELHFGPIISIQSDLTRITASLKLTKVLLSFEEPQKNFLLKLLEKNIIIVTKVNSNNESKSSGVYKVYNDTSNYRKLAFIVTLLYQTLKKDR